LLGHAPNAVVRVTILEACMRGPHFANFMANGRITEVGRTIFDGCIRSFYENLRAAKRRAALDETERVALLAAAAANERRVRVSIITYLILCKIILTKYTVFVTFFRSYKEGSVLSIDMVIPLRDQLRPPCLKFVAFSFWT
jgi:hypothetical protein